MHLNTYITYTDRDTPDLAVLCKVVEIAGTLRAVIVE